MRKSVNVPTGEEGCLTCLLITGIGTDDVEEASSLNESGNRFYQHYEILTRADGSRWELGRGAMGVTYKARDINLDTPVALKIINAHFSARPDARRRFLHEAQAAARLRHPNVASVFHFGTINAVPTPEVRRLPRKRMPMLAIAFTRWSLSRGKRLKSVVRRTGPLTPALHLRLACKWRALWRRLSTAALVHRDLKPSNIMLAGEREKAAAEGVLPDAERSLGESDRLRAGQASRQGGTNSDGFLWNGGVCQPGANPNPPGRRSFGYLLVGRNPLVLPDRKSPFSPTARPKICAIWQKALRCPSLNSRSAASPRLSSRSLNPLSHQIQIIVRVRRLSLGRQYRCVLVILQGSAVNSSRRLLPTALAGWRSSAAGLGLPRR